MEMRGLKSRENGEDPASYMDEIDYPPVPEDLVENGLTNGSTGFARRKRQSTQKGYIS